MLDCIMSEDVHVLLVEDDEIDVEAVKREFKKHNIKNPLHHAMCGIEALELLRGENQKEKLPFPYVMLVDINMPQMNGLEFLREVRSDENLKESVAFILTTSARDVDVDEAYRLNAAGYFLKDNMNDLVNMLSLYRKINQFTERSSSTH